jgi:hypothetical protein
LQHYKLDIAEQTSIPQIHYLQEQSGIALDNAMDMIAVAMKEAAKSAPQPMAVKSPGENATVIVTNTTPASPAVAPKPAKAIRAADLCSKSYLETEAEVDEYLEKLKAELLAAINAGQKARIE